MKSILVTYDLCSPGKDYAALYDKLKSFNVWAKITESTWFIKSDQSCVEIRDDIKSIIDNNDRIFVAELTGVAAWKNVKCENEYLKEKL